MGINRMTGTPWHLEQVHREDGDARRYKGRCQYYDYNGNYCSYFCGRCRGSAHCDHYIAISEKEFKRRQLSQKNDGHGTGEDDVYWY